MQIFQPVEPPLRHRDNPLNAHAGWFTWSDAMRELILHRLPEPSGPPTLVHLLGGKPYDQTLAMRCGNDSDDALAGNDPEFAAVMRSAALSLRALDPNEHDIMLF